MLRLSIRILFHSVLSGFLLTVLLGSLWYAPVSATPLQIAGGDDVLFQDTRDPTGSPFLVTASTGEMFSLLGQNGTTPTDNWTYVIYRSTDGGLNWSAWFEFTSPGHDLAPEDMFVAEGTVDRLYIVSSTHDFSNNSLTVTWTDLGTDLPIWQSRSLVTGSSDSIMDAEMTSDAAVFSSYYLYLVYKLNRSIWFTRSTDYGNTWSTAYKIADYTIGDTAGYIRPHIAFGRGGILHVAWSRGFFSAGSGLTRSLHYRRALNYANGGLADWQPATSLTTTANGEDNDPVAIAASVTSDRVYLLYGTDRFVFQPRLWYSDDGGATWPAANVGDVDAGGTLGLSGMDLSLNADETKLRVGGTIQIAGSTIDTRAMVMEADWASPLAFGAPACFSDPYPDLGVGGVAMDSDPTDPDAYALTWAHFGWFSNPPTRWPWKFDATWRGAPGFPSLELGSPYALTAPAASAPALAEVDGDPELEILFTDDDGQVQVYNPDGTTVTGWPQPLTWLQPGGLVAAGRFDNGEMAVVVGEGKGLVRAWDAAGNLLPGFPVDLGTDAPAFVTMAPVAAPYARSIVACSGKTVRVLNYAGRTVSPVWTVSQTISYQAAVADLKFTGQPDIVVAAGNDLVIIDPTLPAPLLEVNVTPYAMSGAPVIGDLLLDGTRDILLPTVSGFIHDYAPDGTNQWSYGVGSGAVINGLAIGNILGLDDLEIAATTDLAMISLYSDGTSQPTFPQAITGSSGILTTGPIISGVDSASPSLTAVTDLGQAWSFHNLGGVVTGWPRLLGGGSYQTPASADIDNDGSNEIVVLGSPGLFVIDVHHAPAGTFRNRYPMAAHDAGRSGCQDCVAELVTAVGNGQGDGRPTGFWFAAPQPNPSVGQVLFQFAIPGPAGVQLDVYDVRGHRVRHLRRTEMNAGSHVVNFDNRDNAGRHLSSGIYYAKLAVRGAGTDKLLSRKFTVLK